MFDKWLKENDLSQLLILPEEYKPYPTASDRDGWKKAAISAEKRDAIIEYANEHINFEWPPLLATSFMAFKRTGERDIYERNFNIRESVLSSLVIAECIDGEGKYIDAIINGIWATCEESFWGISAHNTPTPYGVEADALPDIENHYIDIMAARKGALIAHALYLLRDRLERESKRLVRRMRYELTERIIKPFLRHDDFWWMGFTGRTVNNWNPWAISNIISVVLLTEQDKTIREEAIIKAFHCLDKFIGVYHDDGGCDEGTSYWNVAGGALFDCLEQLEQASDGKINFWDVPLIKEIGRFIQRSYIANDYFINFADGGARVQIDNDMIYRYGKAIGDKTMISLGENFPSSNKHRLLPSIVSRFLRHSFYKQPPVKSTLLYENDVWMSGIQVMAARQFPDSIDGLYLAAKGGHNDESHNHNDVGNFIAYYNGQPLIIDVGVGNYTKKTFSHERYDIWTMQSQYHNLPTINGQMQKAGQLFKATDATYESDKDKAFFSLDIKDAYPAEASLVYYKRAYLLQKGDEGSLTITDDYEFQDGKNTLTLNIMCHKKPEQEQNHINLYGEGGALTMHYAPEDLQIAIEECPVTEPRLLSIWGGNLYRIVITPANVGKKGKITLKIKSQ